MSSTSEKDLRRKEDLIKRENSKSSSLIASKQSSSETKLRPGTAIKPFKTVNADIEDDKTLLLKFDSFFEGGNLQTVFEREPLVYDIYIRNDSNGQGNIQWFYFRVRTGTKLPQTLVRFNIVNLTKKDSLFEMVPS
jgi:hypothetical protein